MLRKSICGRQGAPGETIVRNGDQVGDLYSNLFVTDPGVLSTLGLQKYVLTNEVDPREFYTLMKGLESRLVGRGMCSATSNGMVFVVQNSTLSAEEKVGNVTFSLVDEPLFAADNYSLQENLVQNALKIRARSLAYGGPEGGKFYRRNPYKTDFLNYHDAFESSVRVFHDGRVGIWL